MIQLDWSNPKITLADLDLFLSNYLLTNYDGVLIEDSKLYVRYFEPITAEQEAYIKDWYYSLNGIPSPITIDDESRDSDGVLLTRLKIAANGAKFKTHHIYFKTSDLDSLKERKEDGTSHGYSTLKLYDINGDEITDNANEGDAVKTVIEFEPSFTYEIIGGGMYQKELPASPVVAYAVFAPTIPEAYGGQVHFLNEAHLNMMGTGKILDLDGYVPKKITHDSVNHSGRFNFTFHHAAGLQHELLMFIKIFVP